MSRRRGDRRRGPTSVWSRYAWVGGRRRGTGRRAIDHAACFVDTHGAPLFLVAVLIVALNFLDAWYTIYFLSHGGQELNPIIDSVLRVGVAPFVFLKSLGIGICVAVLTLTKNYPMAKLGLGLVLGGYLLLLGWHLYLYANVPA